MLGAIWMDGRRGNDAGAELSPFDPNYCRGKGMARACTCNRTLLPDRYEDCMPSDDHDSARRRPVRAMPSMGWYVHATAIARSCWLILMTTLDWVMG